MKPSDDTLSRRRGHSPEDQEPLLTLDIIDCDMLSNPEKRRLIDEETVGRFRHLVGHVEIELERPLSLNDK